ARSGADVAARAARRSPTEPPKRWSTRIDTAAAPAASNPAASPAGSASGRRSPADGERRFTSAIAPSPGAASASRKRPTLRVLVCLVREGHQLLQPGRSDAGVDRLPSELEPFGEVVRVASGGD